MSKTDSKAAAPSKGRDDAPAPKKAAPKAGPDLDAARAAAVAARLKRRGIGPAAAKAAPASPTLTAQRFALSAGKRPAHVAGFLAWARAEKLGRRTAAEWAKVWERYLARPVI